MIYKPTSAIYEAIATYEVAYTSYMLILYATKWRLWGMFIHGKMNFAFPPTLFELDCNRRSYLRGSGTPASPHKRLASIGGLCQALVARKNSEGRRKGAGFMYRLGPKFAQVLRKAAGEERRPGKASPRIPVTYSTVPCNMWLACTPNSSARSGRRRNNL